MSTDPQTLTHIVTAAWVAPMRRNAIRDGAVAFRDGRILAVGTDRAIRAAYRGATVTELGAAILLPGLVNAHVHLDLSNTHRPPPPVTSFTTWLAHIGAQSARFASSPQAWADAALTGARESLRFGVTSVGDIIGRSVTEVRAALEHSKILRGTSYGEVLAIGTRRQLLDARLAKAITPAETSRLQVGVSPHAPYSIEPEGFRRCLQASLPLATHLAEMPHEAEFLAHHTGPFRELADSFNLWDDRIPTFTGGPIRYAKSLGLLDYPTLLAHVNYCDDDELTLLAAGQASVVYCPRTHAYFGHLPHRWRDMLARGINVALGTDSRASSPDLNLLDDLRLLHTLAPQVPADQLWPLITTHAAKAISRPDVGSLTPGHHADLTAFPTTSDNPLLEILESTLTPCATCFTGQRVAFPEP